MELLSHRDWSSSRFDRSTLLGEVFTPEPKSFQERKMDLSQFQRINATTSQEQ